MNGETQVGAGHRITGRAQVEIVRILLCISEIREIRGFNSGFQVEPSVCSSQRATFPLSVCPQVAGLGPGRGRAPQR